MFFRHGHSEFEIRIERFGAIVEYADALAFVTGFYTDNTRRANTKASDGFKSGMFRFSHATLYALGVLGLKPAHRKTHSGSSCFPKKRRCGTGAPHEVPQRLRRG